MGRVKWEGEEERRGEGQGGRGGGGKDMKASGRDNGVMDVQELMPVESAKQFPFTLTHCTAHPYTTPHTHSTLTCTPHSTPTHYTTHPHTA